MKALMQVRAHREEGAGKFPNEPSGSLAKTGRIVVPSSCNIARIARTNFGLHGVNRAKGAVGIKQSQAALRADCATVAAKFMPTFVVTAP